MEDTDNANCHCLHVQRAEHCENDYASSLDCAKFRLS